MIKTKPKKTNVVRDFSIGFVQKLQGYLYILVNSKILLLIYNIEKKVFIL